MTPRPCASTSTASAVRSRSCHESPRPVATTTPSRDASQPPSIAPTSPAEGPTRGRSSLSGAKVRRRARRMTRSASVAMLQAAAGSAALSQNGPAPIRSPHRRRDAAVSVLVRGTPRDRPVISLQKVALDDAAALELLELQCVRCYLKRSVEWQQADELATQDFDACIVRATFDFAPHRGERCLCRVEEIHGDLITRRIGELESEGLHGRQSSGG